MIIAVDVETRGLDATKYILGCLCTERTPNKTKTFYNKKALWNHILELGEAENKRGKTLNVYSHNAAFDTASYFDWEDTGLSIISQKPFIAQYKNNQGKVIVKFLDTLNLYRMSLCEAARKIGLEKGETPEELLQPKGEISATKMKQIEEYCAQDTKICLQLVLHLKNKIKRDGINIKRMYTINQIAIQYLLKLLKQTKQKDNIFWNEKTNTLKPKGQSDYYKEKGMKDLYNLVKENQRRIHKAYRGGRVEIFTNKERIEEATEIDLNSLYPYALTQIRFPDLTTERLIRTPLNKGKTKEEILEEIGITKCLIKNETNKIGLLQIRTPNENTTPKSGKYLLGTWTNQELKIATQEGYRIIDIEWTLTYKETENPFKQIMNELYQKRTNTDNEFDKYFYKMIMNAGIGKFAQTHTGATYQLDNIEKSSEYLKKGYKVIKAQDYNYLYTKQPLPQDPEREDKPYYCPIIPTLCNANARITLYNHLKKIKQEDLLYCDTDSIIMTNSKEYLKQLPINKNLGGFKVKHLNEPMIIYNKKTISLGDETRVSGTSHVNIEEFRKGIITNTKMITQKTSKNTKEIGKFQTTTRNLKEEQKIHKEIKEETNQQTLFIDHEEKDITYFIPAIEKELKI